MLAYIDSITAGLVPCKVVAVQDDRERFFSSAQHALTIMVRVTAARPGYAVGDIVPCSQRMAVPRTAVYRSRQACGQYRILPYDWHKEAAHMLPRGSLVDVIA